MQEGGAAVRWSTLLSTRYEPAPAPAVLRPVRALVRAMVHRPYFTFVVLAAIATALAVYGRYRRPFRADDTRPLTHALYDAARLFTLNGPAEGDLHWTYDVARFLAPLAAAWVTVAAVFRLFGDRARRLFLPWLHGHVVVCGTGSKGSRLAEEALERGLRVVVVEIDADNPNLGPLRRDGATVIAGDARDDDVLREAGVARAGVVIACTRRDGDNIEVAGLVCRLVNTERPRRMHPRASRVRCFAHVADAELVTCALCDPTLTRPDDDFELRLFSRHDVAARMLATDHLSRALASPATCARQVHVVLAGLGRTGEAVACAALEFPHAPIGAPLHLTVVDRDAAVRVESFVRRRRLTRAENGVRDLCTIEARPLVVVDPRAFTRELEAIHGRRPVDAVVVWLEDDTLAVECGLDARPWAIEHGVPVFVRARRGAGVATLLRGDGAALRNGLAPVTAFGQDEETCGWDVVVGERLDELGRAIHEGYLSTVGASGDPGQQWHALPEVDARSNLGQADHIPFKLAALGLRIAPGTSPADACPFTDAEIEFLARLEHDRWVADRLLLGFRLPRAGESKDKVRRIHPDLVPWEDLSEAARRKDQDPVRAIASLLRRLRVHAVRDGG